jgi:nicotinamidase/pyrazinamidase
MSVLHLEDVRLGYGDALLVVDVQNDFLPGGSQAVPGGDEVIPVLNQAIHRFEADWLPIFATRDWHPPRHSSFVDQGGPWPPHCVQGSQGAEIPQSLLVPGPTIVISKGTRPEKDAYSGFDGTDLKERLRSIGIKHLFVGGLATDYCVLATVRDALDRDFAVSLLVDAIRAVNVRPDDGARAIEAMRRLGAVRMEVGPHRVDLHAHP